MHALAAASFPDLLFTGFQRGKGLMLWPTKPSAIVNLLVLECGLTRGTCLIMSSGATSWSTLPLSKGVGVENRLNGFRSPGLELAHTIFSSRPSL